MVRLALYGRDFYGAVSGPLEMFIPYEAVNLLIHRAAQGTINTLIGAEACHSETGCSEINGIFQVNVSSYNTFIVMAGQPQ
jgi:hypothetical protein